MSMRMRFMVTPRAVLSIGCREIAAGAGAPSQYPEAMKCDYYARGGRAEANGASQY